jgi:hypothetical protein
VINPDYHVEKHPVRSVDRARGYFVRELGHCRHDPAPGGLWSSVAIRNAAILIFAALVFTAVIETTLLVLAICPMD